MTTASTPPDDETSKVIRSKLQDAQTPGFEATFDPDEAERAGAFAEDALSASDAAADAVAEAGSDDVPADAATLEPVFLDDDGPADDVPPHVSTANARELFGLKPSETVAEAVARQAKEG